MSNLKKLSTGQLPTLIKSISKNDNQVLYYILNKPLPFRLYQQKDKQDLGTFLVGIIKVIGIKEQPQSHIRYIVNLLVEEFPNFSMQELNKALRMAMSGKLDVDNNHYQNLTPMYLTAIINAYKIHRGQVYKRYKQEQDKIEREKPDIKPTKDEVINTSINLLKTEYEDYIVDPDVYRDSEFRYTQYKFIYKFLVEYNIIKPFSYTDDKELKLYIIDVFKSIEKSKLEIREWLNKEFIQNR